MKRITLALCLLLSVCAAPLKAAPSHIPALAQPWMQPLKAFFAGSVFAASYQSGVCISSISGLNGFNPGFICAVDNISGNYSTHGNTLQVSLTGSTPSTIYLYVDGNLVDAQGTTGAGSYSLALTSYAQSASFAIIVEELTSKALNVINLTVRQYCITGLTGVLGTLLPPSVCAGESYYTDYSAHTGTIGVIVNGSSVTETQLSVIAGGTLIGTVQVNNPGIYYFNLENYLFADPLEIMIEPG
jgi:hypothetical protein